MKVPTLLPLFCLGNALTSKIEDCLTASAVILGKPKGEAVGIDWSLCTNGKDGKEVVGHAVVFFKTYDKTLMFADANGLGGMGYDEEAVSVSEFRDSIERRFKQFGSKSRSFKWALYEWPEPQAKAKSLGQ